MTPELLDRRVLGAVRFVDASTASTVQDGLSVQSAQADLRRNLSGLWVIWNAPGLEPHTAVFDQPPAAPPLGSVAVTLTVADNAARYLARHVTIPLPRDPAAANADHPVSLFQPVDVALYPAPAAPVMPGWAVIRAHISNAATNQGLAGALLRVLRTADQQVLARGMSDSRGEALVVVPGIPVTTFNAGDGPALATEVDVTVEAIFDPAAGAVTDPEAVESKAGLPRASSAQKLAAGRELAIGLAVTVA
jgi:hypothetical protein